MVKLSRKKIADRNNPIYHLALFIFYQGYKRLANPHVELDESLKGLKEQKGVFLYAGMHKSLWETTGILTCLHHHGLPIPYTGMGDNLVKGKFFQSLSKKTGLFFVKRAKTRREIIESARMLKEYILNFVAHNVDVLVYPEGTRKSIPVKGRYGDFFPTAFEAVLEYERKKDELIAGSDSDIEPLDTYIVPFNLDYSWVREDWELVEDGGEKPRTLHIMDSLKMLKNVGDVYLSFGKPIKVADHLAKNRKEMALFSRERCLELVKILPINVVCRAILDAHQNGKLGETDEILRHIELNVNKLKHLEERFRGFSSAESPRQILDKVTAYEKRIASIDEKNLKIFKLYADYIHHYLDPETSR